MPQFNKDNLKLVLMTLGNTLISEYGYIPEDTHPIIVFTEWLNNHSEAREVLAGLGIKFPVVEMLLPLTPAEQRVIELEAEVERLQNEIREQGER